MVDKVLAKISTRIYLEHQTNNIRAAILYTRSNTLGLATASNETAKSCKHEDRLYYVLYFQHKKNESTLYHLEPNNLRRVAKMYDLKQEIESVTPKPKRTEIVDKILSVDRR